MNQHVDRSRSILTGMLRPSRAIVFTIVLVAGLVTGCGATPTAAPGTAATPLPAALATPAAAPATARATAATVVISDFLFAPPTLTVPAGATVSVDNHDGANHTLTANDGSFDTGNIPGHATGTLSVSQ